MYAPRHNYSPIETTFFQVPFDKTKLKDGVNTLAVEVHQALYSFPPNPTNAYPRNDFSDLRFDLRITGITAGGPGASYTLNTAGTHVIRTRIKSGSTWSPLTEATFIVGALPASAATLVVSELHYHPSDPTAGEIALGYNSGNDFEFIELMNISATQPIDLTNVKLEDAIGVMFNFANAAGHSRFLPPGGRVVIVENSAAFSSRLRPGATPVVAGEFTGNFSNGGELLTIRAANGGIVKQFAYQDDFPWPTDADGFGYSLVLNDPFANPDHGLASSWHASALKNGVPGGDDHTAPPPGIVWGADSDNDGTADGLEYAMGTGGANPPAPTTTYEDYTPPAGVAATYLYFRFQRNLEASGVTLAPQTSTDLFVWNTTGIVYVSSVHNADGTATETWRTTQPASALPASWFARVSATR